MLSVLLCDDLYLISARAISPEVASERVDNYPFFVSIRRSSPEGSSCILMPA